ncbi:MAG: cysteine synthase [Candidatus Firestonebacteria bacterium]|nr:cysteine synthase [Candidatus Firestonebacteria bacterium]
MSKIYQDITKTIGNTPLVRINKINAGLNGEIAVKLESFNPIHSVKERIALAMIEDAEKKGLIKKDTVKLILTMPETMSLERRAILRIFGAEIVLTDGSKGMNGAVEKAKELGKQYKKSFIPQQFENEANTEAHRKTTAEEIWNDTDGKVDYFVSGIGTGGTVTGVGEVLKKKKPSVKIIGVEPFDSPLLSEGKAGPHKIQGIGANFVPGILNRKIINEYIKVKNEDAGSTARILAKEEGILAGISSGAALWAALEIAKRPESKNKLIVALLPDTGERYLSTWLFQEYLK